MTSTPAGSSTTYQVHQADIASGGFMLTLCRLAAPVSIRPPQAPQLKSYRFFTSSSRQLDGSELLYLHMGYFATLDDAEKWARIARERYPDAFATTAPPVPPMPSGTEPCPQARGAQPGASPTAVHAPVPDPSLSDTQVLKILEKRGATSDHHEADQKGGDEVALLRPEDTSTRQALKEAVVQGAPVSFAVQLDWSTQPLDTSRVPALAIFKDHALYVTETHRQGRSRYFLRLGFFADPVSAKEVAVLVRGNFASAAVVPIADQEVTRARAACQLSASIPCLRDERGEAALASNTAFPAPAESKSVREVPQRVSRHPETLEQTLKRLAAREKWTDPDALSESGVRHLRIEVHEQASGRSRAAK